MIEVIKDSYLGLNREEKDGSYICIPGSINKPLFFNKTLYEIFSVCDKQTIEQVKFYMIHRYIDVSEERIAEGVEKSLWYLRNIGIIKIKGEKNMNQQVEEEIFVMPEERDFEEVSKFMHTSYESEDAFWFADSNITLEKKSVIRSMYKVETLRYGHATGSNLIYKYSSAGSNQIDGIVIFNIHSLRRVAYIQVLAARNEEIAQKILEQLKTVLNENRIRNMKVLLTGRKKEKDSLGFFLKQDFIQEAILKDESFCGDLYVYSLREEN